MRYSIAPRRPGSGLGIHRGARQRAASSAAIAISAALARRAPAGLPRKRAVCYSVYGTA
jgi:hypothetical protein